MKLPCNPFELIRRLDQNMISNFIDFIFDQKFQLLVGQKSDSIPDGPTDEQMDGPTSALIEWTAVWAGFWEIYYYS